MNANRQPEPTVGSATDPAAMIAAARALRQAAAAGSPPALLRGKNFGLLCLADDSADEALFVSAATELGAKVTRVPPDVFDSGAQEQQIARLLGRLYDGIECEGVPDERVRQLRADAGVPVYDGIGCAAHPIAALASLLGDDADGVTNRRHLVQALLLASFAEN